MATPETVLSALTRGGSTNDGQMYVRVLANAVAKHLPKGYVLSLNIERGAAWVELLDPLERPVKLPDAADKTLEQQVNDALCAACGW